MKIRTMWTGITVIGVGLIMGTNADLTRAAELGDVDEPIKLAVNEWTGQHITTHVAGGILERMEYKVEYVTAGYLPQFVGLADGTISATLEIWSNNVGEHFYKAEATGNVVNLGDLGLKTREGWVYPKHMEEVCPGLPDWHALRDCSEILTTSETYPDGRILGVPADWGNYSTPIIKGLDIPFQQVPAGSEGSMVAELQGAATKKSPLVMFMWYPHWVFAEVDVGWVDLPTFEPACLEDPSWGPNPNEVNDCGLDPAIPFKAAWTGMKEKWPAAFEFLKAYQFKVEDQIRMMAAIDQYGEALEKVAEAWVTENEATWKPWADAATR